MRWSIVLVVGSVLAFPSISQTVTVAAPGDLLRTFPNPTGESGVSGGTSIAAVGNNVLFGVGYDDTGLENAGVAYLFDVESATILHTFVNPDPHLGDHFGACVASVGNDILIGSSSTNYVAAPQSGTVYLFEFNESTEEWGTKHTFANPFPNPGDGFGYSIAAVGTNVLISAPNDDTTGGNAGAAYLFDTSGELLHTFFCPVAGGAHYFGSSVAAVGDRVLIGAGGSGLAAYMFEFNDSTDDWELSRTFPNPVSGGGGRFGQSVAGVGDNVLIGAVYDETAYLFDSETEKVLYTLQHPAPVEGENFGRGVAAVGDNVLIGGYYDHADGFRAGPPICSTVHPASLWRLSRRTLTT